MARIATDYLDDSAKIHPDKVAFVDELRELTFKQLQDEAWHIASALIELGHRRQPVLVYLDKGVEVIAAFQGISYSGNYYSPIDTHMPKDRIEKIVNKFRPVALVTDYAHREEAAAFADGCRVILYEEAMRKSVDASKIAESSNAVIDSDILYVLFTSGSTGTPKGVIVSHRGIVDFTEWAADQFGFDSSTIMANQSPFYFSMSVYEIFETLKCGCMTYIVPQNLFSQPTKLMKYLDEKEVNTLVWVPSVLMFLSSLNALARPHLKSLRNVFFGAEVLQAKHLNRWMDEYPNVRFVNIYGPTEVTDTCTWYEVDRRIADDEAIPIGKSCKNKDCFLLDGDNLVTQVGEIGELCMRGSGLAYGYYNDSVRTAEAFVQNPLNQAYYELIYRTGDLARYNEDGDLVYVCRKDFQIKHRGRRIELGEIETAASALDGVEDNCCLYDNDKLRIVLFYTGAADGKYVTDQLAKELPDYMIPGKRVHLDALPKNLNGKTDRQKLKSMLVEL